MNKNITPFPSKKSRQYHTYPFIRLKPSMGVFHSVPEAKEPSFP